MKTLLIVTGPQGSGNHLFSKIFSRSPLVFGWKELTETYWIAHDKEPFAEAWADPDKLKTIQFDQDYAVTSISCPYAYKGKVTIPNFDDFVDEALDIGYKVKFAIIGRDATILRHQQERVRLRYSFPDMLTLMPRLEEFSPIFLSTELLYLYREYYVRTLSTLLDFPVSISDDDLRGVLLEDPNAKYFTAVNEQPLDPIVRKVSGIKKAK
jgi:hypothetical protein